MLRILTLATLFPDAGRPTFGIFVERQTLELARHPDVELQVVAPVGIPPWPLSLHPHYRPLAALPAVEQWKGLRVHRPRFPVLPLIGGRLSPALLARALRPLLRDIRRDFPFDLIDAQFFFPDGPAAARLGREFGVPFSIKARGADIHHWGTRTGCRDQIIAAGREAGGLLAVSAALREDMIALGLPGDRIRVHHTGVDLDHFRPLDRAEARRAAGVDGPLLISVGHLIERKGHGLAIQALGDLPGVTLLIVGEGPLRGALTAQAAALGLGDRVRLLGALPPDRLPALFSAADALVLASSSEGLANVWVEALACGTPIVITDAGGAREVVSSPDAGRIVERDPQMIAAAVRDLLAAPPDREAVRTAAGRFTWARNRDALHAHLRAISDARR